MTECVGNVGTALGDCVQGCNPGEFVTLCTDGCSNLGDVAGGACGACGGLLEGCGGAAGGCIEGCAGLASGGGECLGAVGGAATGLLDCIASIIVPD